MMKFVCLFVCVLWIASAVEAAFIGPLTVAHFGAATGWAMAAMAFLIRDLDERRT